MHLGTSTRVFFIIAMLWTVGVAEASVATKIDAKPEVKAGKENVSVGLRPPFPIAKPVDRLPPKLFPPGDIYYPAELAKSGVQGEVKLDIVLSAEAKLMSAKIVGSSKSDVLDKNALAYAQSEKWTLPETHPKGENAHYLMNLVFIRDSVLSINLKTCAELNTDLGYWRSINPDAQASKVASLELIASLFTVQLLKTRGAAAALKYAQSLDAINAETIRLCEEKPDARVIETYVKTAKSYKIRF